MAASAFYSHNTFSVVTYTEWANEHYT